MSATITFDENMLDTNNQTSFLRNSENKSRLIQMMWQYFSSEGVQVIQAEDNADVLICTTVIDAVRKMADQLQCLPSKSLQESKILPSKGRQESKSLPSKGRQESKSLPSKGRQENKSLPSKGLQESKSLPSKGRQENKSLPSKGLQESKSLPSKGLQESKSLPSQGLQEIKSLPSQDLQEIKSFQSKYRQEIKAYRQEQDIVQDFCKLSLDFLRKGPNPKLYQTAAQKLNVSPEVIRNAVDGLVHLLVESCRNKILCVTVQLDEQDFQDSVLALGFNEQQQQTLSTFYHSKKEEIQSALLRPTLDIPHYQDLDWRVDIQLASRALHHQVTPLVTMKLSLDNGQCVPLQTDPNNLLHMTQVLEQALQEAKGQHTRRIQRTFK
uniref:COMM domain-containing protein n=1 Tax=Timema bartmani TaxID=61472 RepID=A0A7R9EZ01_9NEOP|nr:unnamed protein product [Timema bartmani]